MSTTATHTHEGGIASHPAGQAAQIRARARPAAVEPLTLVAAFAGAVARYLLAILPQVGTELAHWRAMAARIPDYRLRLVAADALRKRGNVEGAALFATLAPAVHRRQTVRALVAFQTAYNYLDALSELPSEDPIANGDRLHQALRLALSPGEAHLDYYELNLRRDDGGYLTAILDACRQALAGLPSYALVAPGAQAAAARIVDYQALNLSQAQGGHDALERWAIAATPARSGLAWWETAAAAGSSLSVNALIAAAADPHLDPHDAGDVDGAYFPWIGALHSLLDSLVDRREDLESGRRCLLDYYPSTAYTAGRLAELALQARQACGRLPRAHVHRVIVTAMGSYYLTAPESRTVEGRAIARALGRELDPALRAATGMFRVRRLYYALTRRTYV